jgi:hypothetical protein
MVAHRKQICILAMLDDDNDLNEALHRYPVMYWKTVPKSNRKIIEIEAKSKTTDLSQITVMAATTEHALMLISSSLQKFYEHHYELVDRYKISISQMGRNLLPLADICSFFYHRQDFYRTWIYK